MFLFFKQFSLYKQKHKTRKIHKVYIIEKTVLEKDLKNFRRVILGIWYGKFVIFKEIMNGIFGDAFIKKRCFLRF